ncbi:aldehyde dehydrogenase family protein [Nitrosomonas sp.]|uniref:aldehyde dehydrogenase family protein n=1 Tax=Nitrosomonas sp. TaxID=42353 RepID=UPI00273150A6|nr:aldehyde dehydrogenase family protein [Nitrosomonas sp.]MDP1788268.1 aldehyde dehydrogenase family protein [Nitrosomonas sp.]MDP2224169.1 aldehyde dehydrogenase family protein [Nitrosomonas sp.]
MEKKLASQSPYSNFDQLFINGQWRHGKGAKILRDLNPYDGSTLVEIPHANRDDMDEAYRGAAKAQHAWAALIPGERAAIMRRAAQIMEARREEIVSWIIHESGGTRIKANLEWNAVHGVLLEAATLPYLVEGRILPADIPGKESRMYRKPVGVVGVISPWNWPFQLTARSTAPALAVGNAVVVKPASDTPVTGGLLFAKILEEAGLPAGVLSVIVGAGSEIGDAFVTHPIPRVISFTGSTPVGRNIARLAAEGPMLKRLELELGGNGPFVVLNDADLGQAVEAAVFGKFLHQGQTCMSVNRFIIEDRIHDAFVERFVDRVRQLKVGDPNAADTMIGPIINESQLNGLQRRIHDAISSGAHQMVGGDAQGLVLPPHVFSQVTNQMPLAQTESFGPIAPIIRARNETDALNIANDTDLGLAAAVFTQDIERGLRFAQQLESGMAHINDQPVNDLPYNPFGGEKNSGIGRFNGVWAIAAFTTDQWITVQHTPRHYPFDARVIK